MSVPCGSLGDVCHFYILRCDVANYKRLELIFRGTNTKGQLMEEFVNHHLTRFYYYPHVGIVVKASEVVIDELLHQLAFGVGAAEDQLQSFVVRNIASQNVEMAYVAEAAARH